MGGEWPDVALLTVFQPKHNGLKGSGLTIDAVLGIITKITSFVFASPSSVVNCSFRFPLLALPVCFSAWTLVVVLPPRRRAGDVGKYSLLHFLGPVPPNIVQHVGRANKGKIALKFC